MAEQLQALKKPSIVEVDRESLIDISQIKIDTEQPTEKRINDYLRQVGNPYMVRVGEYVVQLQYMNCEKSFDDRMEEYITKMAALH